MATVVFGAGRAALRQGAMSVGGGRGGRRARGAVTRVLAVVALAALVATPAALVAAPAVGAQPEPLTEPTPFTDVAGVPWAEPSIGLLAAQGVVQGLSASRFAPGATLDQEQAVTMLARLFPGSVLAPPTTPIPQGVDAWAQAAVEWALAANIIRHPGSFAPRAPAPRAQVAAWVVRAVGLSGGSAPTFADAAAIPSQYVAAVGTAQAAGLVAGDPNGDFLPGEPIDRAQMAVILVRAERALALDGAAASSLFNWTFAQGAASQNVASGQVRVGSSDLPVGSLDAGTLVATGGSVQVRFLVSRGLGSGTLVVDSGGASGTWHFAWKSPAGFQPGTVWLVVGPESPTYSYSVGNANVATFQEVAGQQETSPGLSGGSVTPSTSAAGDETASLCLGACSSGTGENYVGPALPDAVLWVMEVGAAAVLAPGSLPG